MSREWKILIYILTKEKIKNKGSKTIKFKSNNKIKISSIANKRITMNQINKLKLLGNKVQEIQ